MLCMLTLYFTTWSSITVISKHLGANIGDDRTAGSCQGVTLVLEELREGSIGPGETVGEIDFEVTIGRFMGLFHK